MTTINVFGDLFLVLPDEIIDRLESIGADVATLVKGQKMNQQQFNDLQAAVEEDRTVDESAATLLDKLLAMFEANKDDPAAIQAQIDKIRANSAALAASVAKNTPADTGGGTTEPPAGGGTESPNP